MKTFPHDHLVVDCAPLLKWVPPGRVFLVAFIHQPAIDRWLALAGGEEFMLLSDAVVRQLLHESFMRQLYVGAVHNGVIAPVRIAGA